MKAYHHVSNKQAMHETKRHANEVGLGGSQTLNQAFMTHRLSSWRCRDWFIP
jgi:hypothetical protein